MSLLNRAYDPTLDDRSIQREELVFNLAQRAARDNPEMKPVMVELVDQSVEDFRCAGFDGYDLLEQTINTGGRERPVRSVALCGKFQNFVMDNGGKYEGMVKCMPATDRNIALFASHKDENRFIVHDDAVCKKVEQMHEALVLRLQEEAQAKAEENVPVEVLAKQNVLANHGDDIEKMKADGVKRPDMTTEYKGWLQEEVEKLSSQQAK